MKCMICSKQHKEWNNTGICNACAANEGRTIYNRQNGECGICKSSLGAFPLDDGIQVPSSAKLDHDHRTGQIRGVLCSQCNLGLGHFGDDPNKLRTAADYLEKWKGLHLSK